GNATRRRGGDWVDGATGEAGSEFAGRRAKPPNNERAAEAELWRASALTASSDSERPAALEAASASAAKPEALDARPAAVGKSFLLSTSARCAKPRSARTRSNRATTRACSRPLTRAPSSSTRSAARSSRNWTRVVVVSPSSVNDRLGTAGRFRAESLFPQY